MSSAAFSEFQAGVAEVESLRLLKLSEGDDAGLNALNRAAVVLLVSHFEGFLQGLAREFIDALSTGDIEAKRLPAKLREIHTLPTLERILSSGDDVQRHALLKKVGSTVSLWSDNSKPPKGTLNGDTLSRLVTNGRAHVINDLFTAMGEPHQVCDGDLDVPDEERIQTIRIENFLTDLIGCRNAIAHGDQDRKPTSADVERYSLVTVTLAQRLDRKMQFRVESILGSTS